MNFLKKLNLVLEGGWIWDTELDTWLFWVDILQFLGEFESAIQTLLQATEFYPRERNRIPFGWNLFYDPRYHKAKFHLSNGLRLNLIITFLLKTFSSGVVWKQFKPT
jgi:hypothetical protein